MRTTLLVGIWHTIAFLLLYISHFPWSACLSVCLVDTAVSLPKRANLSTCRSDQDSCGLKEPRALDGVRTGTTWRIRVNDPCSRLLCGLVSNYFDYLLFFTARRYASAVYAIVVCLSVCLSVRPWVGLSVTNRYCTETTRRIELVFGMAASFNLS